MVILYTVKFLINLDSDEELPNSQRSKLSYAPGMKKKGNVSRKSKVGSLLGQSHKESYNEEDDNQSKRSDTDSVKVKAK